MPESSSSNPFSSLSEYPVTSILLASYLSYSAFMNFFSIEAHLPVSYDFFALYFA
ncbi:hypothetical protein MmTuc01_3384 [Methanosarcina mazei Tuc01]|uniref:Uncharacterized protein n=1 Tax=Methanosarcina mazei Tuc01 TaxID=1236903 RepID=M1Q8E8_METMZ|nr:hypothetical protein MmTuc01_3384 [Methanosarcina mazei Tuc01]